MSTQQELINQVNAQKNTRESLISQVGVDQNKAFRDELDGLFLNGGGISSLLDDRMKSVLAQHPDDDAVKAKIANSFYIADAYGSDPIEMYDRHDAMVARIFGKGTDSKTALNQIIKAKKDGIGSVRNRLTEKNLLQATTDAYKQAGVRMTKTVAGFAELTGYLAENISPVYKDAFERQSEWGRMMSEGVNEYYEAHPEEFIQAKGSGFIDTTKAYLDNPVAIYQGMLEAVPLMLQAYLGHIVGGGVATAAGAAPKTVQAAQWIGRVQGMATPIMGETYAQLRDRGQHPLSAMPQAFLTAEIEGLIEEWTLGQKLKIFKGMGNIARKGITSSVVKGLYGAGKAYVRGTAEEFTQAINTNFWDMIFTNSDTRIMDGALEQAAAGGLIELGMSGGFAAAGQARSLIGRKQVGAEQKLERIEAVRDLFNKTDMAQEHKDEVNAECDRVRDEIMVEQEADVAEKAPETPVAGQTPSKGGSEASGTVQTPTGGQVEGIPSKLIHITKKANVESIKEQGLRSTEANEDIISEGISLSTKRTEANEVFGDAEVDVFVSSEAKVITLKEALIEMGHGEETSLGVLKNVERKAVAWAKENGYDILDMREARGAVYKGMDEIRVLNPDIISLAPSPPAAKAEVKKKTTPKYEVKKPVAGQTTPEAGSEAIPEPQNIQQEINSTPRYGLGPNGKTVIDYDTQKEVATYGTPARAVREMTSLNSGTTIIAEDRPAALLPSEKGKTYTIRQLLNYTMKGMEKASRQAFLDGARSIIKQHRDLARYAHSRLKNLDITKAQRKQLIDAVARTRTPAQKVGAIATINALFERATHAQVTRDLRKTVRYINKHLNRIMQEEGIRPEYLMAMRDLTDTFSFTKPTAETVKRLESLKLHIEGLRESEMSKYERDFAEELLPKGLVAKLDKLTVKSVKSMTADEIKDIDITLRMLIHLNNVKNRIILDRIARNASEIINGAMAELDNVVDKSAVVENPTLKDDFQGSTAMGKFIRWTATTNNHDLETLVDTIAGGQKGYAFDAIIEAFSDGRTRRDQFSNQVADAVMKTFEDNDISLRDLQEQSPAFERLFKTEKTKFLRDLVSSITGVVSTPTHKVSIAGKTMSLTKSELMSIYMHSNALYNLKAMLKEGVASVKATIGVMTPAEVGKIAAIIEGDAKALACCNMAADLYATLYKESINKESIDIKGIELANEDNYWHIERYTGGGIAGAETFRLSLLESTGWIQPRTGSKNPIIIKDFWEVFINSKKAISEYVGMAKAYRAAKMLFNYKNYREKIRSLGYTEELAAIDELIRNTEQQPLSRAPIDSIVARLMRGTVRVGLSFPGTWIGQWASVFNYFTETDKKYFRVRSIIPASAKEIQRYRDNWSFFRARMDGGVSSIALQDVSQSDEVLRTLTQKTDWINYVTQAIHSVDIRTIAAGGRITEAEMADKNRSGRSQEYWDRRGVEPSELEFESEEYWYEFGKRARYLARRTQPMFEGENRSLHTSVREPSKRMWFLFRSYVDQVLRMGHRENTARINNISSKAKMAQNLGIIWTSLAMFSIIQWLMAKVLYRDERDWKDLGMDIALGPLKLLTIIGYPLQSILKKVGDSLLGKKPSMTEPTADTIVTQFIDESLKASTDLAQGITYLGSKERYKGGPNKGKLKSEVLIERAVLDLTTQVAEYFGIPASRVKRIYEGWTKKPKRISTSD